MASLDLRKRERKRERERERERVEGGSEREEPPRQAETIYCGN